MTALAPPRRVFTPFFAALCALWLGGCGARTLADTDSSQPPAPPAACASPFACPEGQRCDEGLCQPDVSCPAAIAPRLLLEASAGSPISWFVTTLDGRDYASLTMNTWLDKDIPDTHDVLLDLASGVKSTWEHELGKGYIFMCGIGACSSVWPTGGGSIFEYGLHLQGHAWVAEGRMVMPTGYSLSYFPLPGEFKPGTVLISNQDQHELRLLTLATGETEPVLSLGKSSFWYPLPTAQGKRLISRQSLQDPEQSIRYFSAPLTVGAESTFLLDVKAPWNQGAFLVAASDAWFAVHGKNMPGDTVNHYQIYKMVGDQQTLIGVSVDPAFFQVGQDTDFGGPLLGPDHLARTVSCASGRCRLVRVDFDKAVVTEQAVADFGTPGLEVQQKRWLACGAVDVLLGSSVEDPATPDQYRPKGLWYTRMVP